MPDPDNVSPKTTDYLLHELADSLRMVREYLTGYMHCGHFMCIPPIGDWQPESLSMAQQNHAWLQDEIRHAQGFADRLPEHPLVRQAEEVLKLVEITSPSTAQSIDEIRRALRLAHKRCRNQLDTVIACLFVAAERGLPPLEGTKSEKNEGASREHGGAHRRKASRRKRTAVTRRLTTLQLQAVELWAKYNGKVADIAREMNVTHPTVSQHLKAAWRKLPDLAPKKARPVGKPRALPTDRRGQPNV